jgi:hypothetical protein
MLRCDAPPRRSAPNCAPETGGSTIPLGGILTPLDFASLGIPEIGPGSVRLSGTAFGRIVPGRLAFLPE